MDDLPDDGAYGLTVERPQGLRATMDVRYHGEAEGRWNQEEQILIETAFRYAIKEWSPHLKGNPKYTFAVNIMGEREFVDTCGDNARACAGFHKHGLSPGSYYPVWFIDDFVQRWTGGDFNGAWEVAWEIGRTMVHEAGHNLGYHYAGGPHGGAHAPDGSGSVMSYDRTTALVMREDVQRLGPKAQWNGQPTENFTVAKGAAPDSIHSYGIWLTRDLTIDEAVYRPGRGRLPIEDIIAVQPFVTGIHNPDTQPTGNVTWSGDFVGFDIHATIMALLRADTSLRYALQTNQMAVGIANFETYYDRSWHTSRLADQNYNLQCAAGGCSLNTFDNCTDAGCTTGANVTALWGSYQGDPTGAAAGTVTDIDNGYTGAFAAKKD